jgi:hypothetical protein
LLKRQKELLGEIVQAKPYNKRDMGLLTGILYLLDALEDSTK